MPFSAILHLFLICALAAAVSAIAFKPSLPWKMDSFDHEVSARAYSSRFQRHAIYSTVSFEPISLSIPTHVPKGTLSGEEAERIVISLLRSIFWPISKYTTWTLLGYLAIRVVPFFRVRGWAQETIRQIAPQLLADLRRLLNLFALLVVAIYRAITQNQFVFDARQAIRDWYDSTQQQVDRSYDDFANATIFATIYVQFQRMINWTGRHKLRLIVGIVAIHLLSTTISSKNVELGEVFVTWNELQPYIDQPIPWHMFRQRSEDGSNSHYWPPVIDDAPLESAGPISTSPTTTMLPMAATDEFVEDAPRERHRKLLGEEMAFCHHCRQKHCCEICL